MNAYDLPSSLEIGGRAYAIRSGWRSVMDIFAALNDPELDTDGKVIAMLTILFPEHDQIPPKDIPAAIASACEFLDCGQQEKEGNHPRLMDWEQDAPLIVPAVNAVTGRDIRLDPNLHWWTFFGMFMSVEGGLFGSVLRVRQKKAKGKKLDKWEEEFYRENKNLVDLKARETSEIRAEKDNILKYL